jgi:hypothetical protein
MESAKWQTVLFTPAFRDAMLSFLKSVQLHWFPRELHGVDIVLQLLRMGVWCNCENEEPPFARGTIVIKRRRADGGDAAAPFLLPPLEKWKISTYARRGKILLRADSIVTSTC